MISPAPGSTLTSASDHLHLECRFRRSDGLLSVGWHGPAGTANLVNIGPASVTSATVNLPTNGATIYVRLWTVVNGATYLYNDYTYTEATPLPPR